jgi:hypothetical protein
MPANDGGRDLGDESNPGGREKVEEDGAIRSRARLAPAEAVLASKGEMVMALALSPLRVKSSTGGQLPIEDGEPGDAGQTDVGDESGSGVPGGVRAALDRRLVARGDAERTRDLPLRRVAVDDTNLPRESRAMATSSRGIPRTTAGGAGGTSATRASGTASCSTGSASSA